MEPEALHAELEMLLDNCRDDECRNFQEICQTALKLKASSQWLIKLLF